MIKLLKRMRRREALMALVCAVLVVAQVYFDLKLPDYMTRLTTLIKTPGSVTSDILSVGGQMLLCTLASAVLAVGCGYLAAKTASGFSEAISVRKGWNSTFGKGSVMSLTTCRRFSRKLP